MFITEKPHKALDFQYLDQLPLGQEGVVDCVRSDNSLLKNKLLSMGIVGETAVKVVDVAPLGDPITVMIKGFKLSLRRSEAHSILLRCKLPEKA